MSSACPPPRRVIVTALAAALLLSPAASSLAAPSDALIPLESYSTAKGKTLATTYQTDLVRLYEHVYNCLPWLIVRNHTLGFPRPKDSAGDDRYLSIMIDVDQLDSDGAFAALSRQRRISAMFSRHGVYLLKQMQALSTLAADTNVTGYGVALSWPKPGTPANQPKAETVAVFVDKTTLVDYLAKKLPGNEFISRAKLSFFDGNEIASPVPVEVWEDSFNSTFKLKNYEPPKGSNCTTG